MASKKDRLATVLAGSGLLHAARTLRRPPRRRLLVLAYHRVLPAVDPATYPFDVELISATPEDFAWQVAFLAKHFSVIPLSRVVAHLDDLRALPENAVVITFDDGFLDNYEHAFPVLKRHGVSATVFVTSSFIGGEEPIWYEALAFAFMRAPAGTLPDLRGGARVPSHDAPAARRADLARVLAGIKLIPDVERRAYLAHLFAAAGPALLATARDGRSAAMSWEQAREMQRHGVEFGSHTVTHPMLSRVDEPGLEMELGESRRAIEAELGRPVEAVAYPIGGHTAFDDRVIRIARAHGYRLGLSYMRGVNIVDAFEPFAVRRLHVERDTTRARFAAMLTAPALFG